MDTTKVKKTKQNYPKTYNIEEFKKKTLRKIGNELFLSNYSTFFQNIVFKIKFFDSENKQQAIISCTF